MPHYITLFRYTQKGVENIKQGPSRLDAGKKAIEATGGKLKGFYLTMGQYDAVAIAEPRAIHIESRAGARCSR